MDEQERIVEAERLIDFANKPHLCSPRAVAMPTLDELNENGRAVRLEFQGLLNQMEGNAQGSRNGLIAR